MMPLESTAPEYSIEIDLEALVGGSNKTYRLTPSEPERRRIAARLGAFAVNELDGEISLCVTKPEIRVRGRIDASLKRECVSSLEEVTEAINEEFEIIFLRRPLEASIAPGSEEELFDQPEVHEGKLFDIGELLVQQLSLALDPFPRKNGAISLAEQYGTEGADSPFKALRGYFDKNKENQ